MDFDDIFGTMPNRPDHPDMHRMSSVLRGMDAGLDPSNPNEEEKDAQFRARLADLGVDEKVLVWAATQRSYRAMGIKTAIDLFDPAKMDQAVLVASIWIDAFAAGMYYQRSLDDAWQDREGHADSHRVHCSRCGKGVSNPLGVEPIVRAWVVCPECVERTKTEEQA